MRRDGEMKPLIWGESKAEYFFMQDWTGFRARRFFARRANHRGVAFNHSAACKASSIAYRCYATTQYAEPVIGRAYEIDHHDLGFKRLNGSRNNRMDRRSQLGFARRPLRWKCVGRISEA